MRISLGPVRSLLALSSLAASPALSQCPEQPPLQNYTGGGSVVCPCFAIGEEAGVVLTAPVALYPIEILRVGIGWASQIGGAPQQLEQSINLYAAGLPNPGAPIFTLPGPQLSDGFINEFNIEPITGNKVINSGAFTVTLEFLNPNAGDIFAPSVIHDGNGCQAGKNVVFIPPGSWFNACALGVTGDWVFYVIYRETDCGLGVGEEMIASSLPAFLANPQPNPFRGDTSVEFLLDRAEHVQIRVHDVAGRHVASLADGTHAAGRHTLTWNGARDDGTPEAAGVYFVTMEAGEYRATRKVVLTR
ncbi:MAG: FlgD immunoglobulin-like domain containing protein [Candidatus Eiseniibacteriota bacterium]